MQARSVLSSSLCLQGSESHPQAQACINRLYPGSEEQPPSLATFWRRYAPVVANSPQSSRSPSPTASPADLGNCQALAAEVATDRISPGTSEITDRDGSPPRARASSEAAHGGAVQGDRRPAFVYQLPCPGGTASVWEEARESPDQDGGVAGAAGRTGLKRPLPGVNNPPSDAVASARPPLAELNANGKAAGKLPAAGGKAVTTSRFFKARPSAEARGEEAGASQAPGSGDDIKQDPGETGPGGETPCAEVHPKGSMATPRASSVCLLISRGRGPWGTRRKSVLCYGSSR